MRCDCGMGKGKDLHELRSKEVLPHTTHNTHHPRIWVVGWLVHWCMDCISVCHGLGFHFPCTGHATHATTGPTRSFASAPINAQLIAVAGFTSTYRCRPMDAWIDFMTLWIWLFFLFFSWFSVGCSFFCPFFVFSQHPSTLHQLIVGERIAVAIENPAYWFPLAASPLLGGTNSQVVY